jgi:hypothetical protein
MPGYVLDILQRSKSGSLCLSGVPPIGKRSLGICVRNGDRAGVQGFHRQMGADSGFAHPSFSRRNDNGTHYRNALFT